MEAKETYKKFSIFYDDYVRGFKKDIPVYRHYSKNCRRILEIGCGSGRILKQLVDSEKTITGVDISPEILKIAQRKLEKAINKGLVKLLEHDFIGGPLDSKHDIAIISWYTFNYVIKKPANFLANIAKILENNAFIILDLFYPETLKHPELNGKWTTKKIMLKGIEYHILDKRRIHDRIEERIQKFDVVPN